MRPNQWDRKKAHRAGPRMGSRRVRAATSSALAVRMLVRLRGSVRATAKLRMLIVDRRARGLGIGAKLVDEAIRFARRAGYRAMTLWTFDTLEAAGQIYARAGFRCEIWPDRHADRGVRSNRRQGLLGGIRGRR